MRSNILSLAVALSLTALIARCASAPKGPDWIRQPTRIVDGGYIVYVGSAVSNNQQRAEFNAEGQALEDLANECSVIPKGARIEDRYIETQDHDIKSYVKLGIEFQECDEARRTNDPAKIKEVANVAFTEQLKRYQDLTETGEMPDREVGQIEPPSETPPPPARNVAWNDETHFFVMRQYVAYQKEVVVLAPPTAYPPGAPQTASFTNNITQAGEQIHQTALAHPTITKQTWSALPNRPALTRPASLAPRPSAMRTVRPPSQHGQRGGFRPEPGAKGKRKGRRRKSRG